MDLMKVFDQTVREIKREVNLKVLKVPEIEQKVLDATDDEPWGPHGTVLAEIARATNKFSECQMVMNVLWTRLIETGKNWRFVYKALAVIEYLVAHGSERAVDDIVEHTFQISSLASFEYVEPNGKDLGINVRKKAETIVALLNNKDKIQEVRNKASENRDKYVGLSSSGITYKSGSATFSGSGSQSSDRYGGFGSEKYGNSSRDSHKNGDRYDEHKSDQSSSVKSRRMPANSTSNASRKGSSRSKLQDTRSSENVSISTQASTAPSNKYDDDFDDFDPRGTSNAKPSSGTSQKMDLFGQDLMGDWLDAPTPVPTENTVLENNLSEVDLFADAAFVSAATQKETWGSSHAQENVDLFASHSTSGSAVPSVDLFAASDTLGQSDDNRKSIDNTSSNAFDPFASQDPSGHSDDKSKKIDNRTSNVFDPFAAIPLNSFDSADPFGTLNQNHANDSITSSLNEVVADNKPVSQSSVNGSSVDIKTQQKKDTFKVKSGIWSDSLSRGLIDLNISAPKKVNLADVGVVGGISDGSDEKEKGPSTLFYKGEAMGSGSGLGKSGFHSPSSEGDDFFSSLSSQQYQFGGFQK